MRCAALAVLLIALVACAPARQPASLLTVWVSAEVLQTRPEVLVYRGGTLVTRRVYRERADQDALSLLVPYGADACTELSTGAGRAALRFQPNSPNTYVYADLDGGALRLRASGNGLLIGAPVPGCMP